MATLRALDGAEYGVVVAGVGVDAINASPTIVTSPVRTGARAWSIAAAATACRARYTVANQICTQAIYVRFDTLPTADADILTFSGPASGTGRVQFINATDQIGLRIFGGSAVVGGPTIVTGTWYRLVIEYDTSANPYVLRCRVDNGTEFSQTAGLAAANQTNVGIGTDQVNQTFTAFYDDWLVSVTDGDYEEIAGWDSHRVESLIPNADGTHNITTSGDFDSFTGTAFSNATTTGFSFIDHRPLQRANIADNVIRQELGTTANYMEFLNEDLSDNADPVDGVRTYATHVESASAGASLGEARLLLADNTEVLTTGSISAINSTEDPGATVTTRDRDTIAPAGGWDGTKVDGLKWRIGFADNAPDVNFIDLMVEVAQHVPAAGQTVDGVVLTITPSLPTGTLNHGLVGTVLSVAPTLPIGTLNHSVTGVALSVTPSLPVGAVTTPGGAQQVDGVVLTVTPSLPTGNLSHSLIGVVLTIAPSLPTGSLRHSLAGTVLQVAPSLPAGSLNHRITGTVLTVTPSFPIGALRHTVTGIVLTVAPTLPVGQVTVPGAQTVTGVVLTITPTLPAGSLTHRITGLVLIVTPILPIGAVTTPAPQTVTGVVLTVVPTLPIGALTGLAVFITEGDVDAMSTALEGQGAKPDSIEGGVLVGAGLEG